MSRRRVAEKTIILPDPKYGDMVLAKFINIIMRSGKKSIAEKIVYGALNEINSKGNSEPIEIFNKALENIRPIVEVKSRRVGGATYQVPVDVRPARRESLAMRWIITAARARTGRPMAERLYQELLEASRGQGPAAKRREDLHRMAEANRAFVHYRW